MGNYSQQSLAILVSMLIFSHRLRSPINPIMNWNLRLQSSLSYSSNHFLMGSWFFVNLHQYLLKYILAHMCLLLRWLLLILICSIAITFCCLLFIDLFSCLTDLYPKRKHPYECTQLSQYLFWNFFLHRLVLFPCNVGGLPWDTSFLLVA